MADLNALENTDAVLQGVAQGVQGFGQGLYLLLYISLAVIIIGGLLWFILWRMSFKFRVKIRELTSTEDVCIIIEDAAKRKKMNGAEFWKLRRRRALIIAPPKGALQITNRGRFYAECMHEEKSGLDAGYRWIVPSKDPKSGLYTISSSQEERALLADRIQRAEERKGRNMLDVIMQFAGMGFVLLVLVVVLAFYSEISGATEAAAHETSIAMQRIQEVTKAQAEFQKTLNDMLEKMDCTPPTPGSVDIPLDQQVVG